LIDKRNAMNYKQSLKYIEDLEMFNIKLGLTQISELLKLLDNPQNKLNFIHLAGTNGKGSTGAMFLASLREAGFNVAMYSSPHLNSIRERFTINNELISKNKFSDIVTTLKPLIEKMHENNLFPTYFEVATTIAMTYFCQENVDFVILETGMGGRFDATNIVTPICSVITSIGLDHCEYLGDSIEKIAFEKAGIIKDNIPVFTSNLNKKSYSVIQQQAILHKSQIKKINEEYDVDNKKIINKKNNYYQDFSIKNLKIQLSLNGEMQIENAKLAFMVLEFLSEKYNFDLQLSLNGLKKVNWQGRFQILSNGNIIDGAHNQEGIDLLIKSLDIYFPNEKFTFFFANFADKNTENLLKTLIKKAEAFIFFPLQTKHRKSSTPEDLKKIVKNNNININCISELSLKAGVNHYKSNKRIVFTGSLYLAGEVLELSNSTRIKQ